MISSWARPCSRAQPREQLDDLQLDGDVERRGRLVGDQQLRLGGERERDHHALAHAARELVRVAAQDPLAGRAARRRSSSSSGHASRLGALAGRGAPAAPGAASCRRGTAGSATTRGFWKIIEISLAAHRCSSAGSRERQQVAAAEQHVAGRRRGTAGGSRRVIDERGHRLAASRSRPRCRGSRPAATANATPSSTWAACRRPRENAAVRPSDLEQGRTPTSAPPRVEEVAQAVADQVEAHDGDGDSEAREERDPPLAGDDPRSRRATPSRPTPASAGGRPGR